ncbi:hypothetical protein ACQ33O_04555 [Ferruginibacter sp. SUN002]|uniref:hypothetical protein n=1 Tax=Ferruginibacter sp. SUN002 TaxID=2937789 RepID=UPI003D3691CB
MAELIVFQTSISAILPDELFTPFERELKRNLLLFDKVCLPLFEIDFAYLSDLWDLPGYYERYCRFKILMDKNYLVKPVHHSEISNESIDKSLKKAIEKSKEAPKQFMNTLIYEAYLRGGVNEYNRKLIESKLDTIRQSYEKNKVDALEWMEREIRLNSIYYSLKKDSATCIPLLSSINSFKKGSDTKKQEVHRIVLNRMPLPSADVSWEHIIEYKSDESSRNKFLALKNWINNVASSNKSISEIEDELEYLLSEYEKDLQLHNLKYTYGFFQTICVGIIELFTEPKKLVERLFNVYNQEIELMESENKFSGKEIAYIVKSNETFS